MTGDSGSATKRSSSSLSPRQIEVVQLAVSGMTVQQTAARLGISRHTVSEYLQAARHRIGASTRAELIAWAVTSGAAKCDGYAPDVQPLIRRHKNTATALARDSVWIYPYVQALPPKMRGNSTRKDKSTR
jgi:DNA-binding CsgD family transcriptional regulator